MMRLMRSVTAICGLLLCASYLVGGPVAFQVKGTFNNVSSIGGAPILEPPVLGTSFTLQFATLDLPPMLVPVDEAWLFQTTNGIYNNNGITTNLMPLPLGGTDFNMAVGNG